MDSKAIEAWINETLLEAEPNIKLEHNSSN